MLGGRELASRLKTRGLTIVGCALLLLVEGESSQDTRKGADNSQKQTSEGICSRDADSGHQERLDLRRCLKSPQGDRCAEQHRCLHDERGIRHPG